MNGNSVDVQAENELPPEVHDVFIGGVQFKIALAMTPDRLVEMRLVPGETAISLDKKRLSSLPTPLFEQRAENG
ncbi:hypothetical protein HB771_09345 [Rhizobium leguminosarum bv. viciae]|nr:hypothetical protein HB771_09345 [Rhizobium leguminosarum bv. viciae]